MSGSNRYFQELSQHVASTWNRFWFAPSDALDLCVLRIFVGCVSIAWHFSFLPDLTTWFGREGWLSRDTMEQLFAGGAGFTGFSNSSYLFFVSSPTWLWTIHMAGSLVLLAMTVGFYTRLASVASLIVLVSYIHRGPLLLGPAAPVLTMLVAYLCLAPAGQYLSWDRWRRTAAEPPSRRTSWTTVARRLIQVHLVMFYLVMGLSKLGGETWWYGEAIWWLAAQPDSQWFDPAVLRSYPVVLNLWTHAVLLGELLFVVLIWNRWFRPIVLAVSTLLWFSVALASGYAGLAITMMVANLAFVPSAFWRARLEGSPVSSFIPTKGSP